MVSDTVDEQPFALVIVSVGEYKLFVVYVKEGFLIFDVSAGLPVKFQCQFVAPRLVSVKLTVMGDEQLAPLFIIKGLILGALKIVIFFTTESGQDPKFSNIFTVKVPAIA